MKIPQGYKQTEFGIIPEDWEIMRLKDIGNFSKGCGISRLEANSGHIPCVRYGEIYTSHDIYIKKFYSFISEDIAKRSKRIKKGDILFTASGETKEEIGKCVAFVSECEAYAGGDIIILTPKSKFDSKYLGFILNTSELAKQKASKGQGDAVVHITTESLSELIVPIPSRIDEQQKIAEALSDVDKLIAALGKKIAKKKLIKQAAMQQLLTGKKRLQGFSEEWEEYALFELLSYEQPTKYLVSSTEYVENGTPVLTAGKTFILGYTNEENGIYKFVPVIIFDDFTTDSKYVDMPFKAKSSAMKILQLTDKRYSLRLIYEAMQLLKFTPYDHQRYWISEYSQLKIKLPTSFAEQQAISKILSDMDEEILDLERKRDKHQLLKNGMMQKLLTGQIRIK